MQLLERSCAASRAAASTSECAQILGLGPPPLAGGLIWVRPLHRRNGEVHKFQLSAEGRRLHIKEYTPPNFRSSNPFSIMLDQMVSDRFHGWLAGDKGTCQCQAQVALAPGCSCVTGPLG